MECPNCKATGLAGTANFCSSCGARVSKPVAAPPVTPVSPTRPVTNLSVDQDVSNAAAGADIAGVRVERIQGDVHIQGGQVVLQTSESAGLKLIESISTEVKAGTAAGIEGSKVPGRLDEANAKLDALLKLIREQEQDGRQMDGVEAGGTHLSRVDLMLKKAALLKIQAEQMMLDHASKNRKRVNLATGQLDLSDLMRGFDSQGYDAKLAEAYGLLEEARRLDPANTEVLLHLAELLTHTTEDDPTDEQRILYEVQSLLRNPKDDTERFRLAQASFLLATSHEPMHLPSLKDAREMFSRLGRPEWVRHCDDLIRGAEGTAGEGGPGSGTPRYGQAVPGAPATQQQFQPAGDWNVRVMDALGSTMTLHLAPDGTFNAAQNAGWTGMTLQASGQWIFNPPTGMLQLQGMIGGFQPFMLGIFIQGWQGDAYYGVGTDGIAYALSRS